MTNRATERIMLRSWAPQGLLRTTIEDNERFNSQKRILTESAGKEMFRSPKRQTRTEQKQHRV